MAQIVAAELPPVLEKALKVELSRFREEVVGTLRDALHSVMGQEQPSPETEDVEDYSV